MNKLTTLTISILLLISEIVIFILLAVAQPTFSAKIFSMITANHIGGRLAFIAVGLENSIEIPLLIFIIIFYNTTYLFVMYSLFVIMSARLKKISFFKRYFDSLKSKAEKRKPVLKKWNWTSIFIFVWVPLPWTGAVIGAYIANLEGMSDKETFLTVLPAMWLGVISWTIWFDELFQFIDRVGKGKTMIITISLLLVPILIWLINLMRSKIKSKQAN